MRVQIKATTWPPKGNTKIKVVTNSVFDANGLTPVQFCWKEAKVQQCEFDHDPNLRWAPPNREWRAKLGTCIFHQLLTGPSPMSPNLGTGVGSSMKMNRFDLRPDPGNKRVTTGKSESQSSNEFCFKCKLCLPKLFQVFAKESVVQQCYFELGPNNKVVPVSAQVPLTWCPEGTFVVEAYYQHCGGKLVIFLDWDCFQVPGGNFSQTCVNRSQGYCFCFIFKKIWLLSPPNCSPLVMI